MSAIDRVIEPRVHDLGGFSVRRLLPAARSRTVGPFVFVDQMGPTVLGPGRNVNVEPHPHIGLSTLTWLFDGEIRHRDSLGHVQSIRPGAVNWMTAGRGIVHSERTPDPLRGREKPLFGLQVWIALPADQTEIDPSFTHYPADQLPVVTRPGARVVVVAGSGWGAASPVAVRSPTMFADITLAPGADFNIPADHDERALCLVDGAVEIEGTRHRPGPLLILCAGTQPVLRSQRASRLILLGGAALKQRRYLWWNFVATSKERLEKAKKDWAAGRFPAIAGESVKKISEKNGLKS